MVTEQIDDTQLINGVIHEIKNPIALIKANIDLINLQSSEYEKNLKTIYKQLEYVEELTCNYLSTFRNKDAKSLYLNDIVDEIVEEYKTSYKDIKIKYFCKNTSVIVGDKKLISIVIKNVLKNAIESIQLKQKIDKEYKGKLFITLEKEDNKFNISVTDNGIGYDSNREHNGNGIGLKIVKKILNMYQGSYHIYNNFNVDGAVQKIIIPEL